MRRCILSHPPYWLWQSCSAFPYLPHHHYCTLPVQFACYIQASRMCTSLLESMHLHALVVMAGLHGDVFLMNHLIAMYGRLGSVADAHSVFETIRLNRNVISWNVLLSVYATHEQPCNAMQLLSRMQSEGFTPNRASFVTAINACTANAAFTEGGLIHCCIVEMAFDVDVVVGTALVKMYSMCGNLHDAHEMFHCMAERNMISWNTMIGAHTQHGCDLEALQLFQLMLSRSLKPTKITFITILQACARLQDLANGMIVHSYACEYEFEIDAILGSTLLDAYAKCGSLADAQKVYLTLYNVKDIAVWNGLIAAYAQHGLVSLMLEVFEQMQVEGVWADQISFTCVLHACADQRALAAGKKIHTHVIARLFQSNSAIANALISMYGMCEYLEAAEDVFEMIDNPSVGAWNSLINIYAQSKLREKLFQLCRRMLEKGVEPDLVTFTSILMACASLNEGRVVHAWVVEHGLAVEVVGNALISMYARLNTLNDSSRVFSRMHKENKASWNTIIGSYVQMGQKREALLLFQRMLEHKVSPDKITYITIFKACDNATALHEGCMLHIEVSKHGYDLDCATGSAVIQMYGNCNSLLHAKHVFNCMQQPDIVAWNSIIKAYAQHGLSQDALQSFMKMQEEGLKPDKVTYVCVLSACGSLAASIGEVIHVQVVDQGFESDSTIRTALGNLYGKCGSVEDAEMIFAKLEQWDGIAWTALLSVYAQNGCSDKAFRLLGQMMGKGLKPDEVCFLNILLACSHTGLLDEGKYWFCMMTQGYGILPTAGHYNCIIDLVERAGLKEDADDFLKKMPLKPQACDWTNFLDVCQKHGDWECAKHAAEHILETNLDCCMFLSGFHSGQDEMDFIGEYQSSAERRSTYTKHHS